MNARHLIPLTVLVAAATVVAAAAEMPADVKTAEGKVVMLTPAVLQLGTDQGTIEEFEVTADSEINDRVTQGDRVTVWYRDDGGSTVVVKSEPAAKGQGKSDTAAPGGQQASGSTGSEGRTGMTDESTSHQSRSDASATAAQPGLTGTERTSWYDQEGTPYPEAVNPPDNAIVGRQGPMRLPDTASAVPAAGLLGLAALAAAAAVAMIRRRI